MIPAMQTQTVELTEDSVEILNRHIESGEFSTASDAVNTALRALESREFKLMRLRELIAEGEKSIAEGRYTEVRTLEEHEALMGSIRAKAKRLSVK